MTTGEFFGGTVLFGLVGVAAAFVAFRVVTCWLRHLDRLERAVAGALVFLAAVLAIHLAPLLLGALSQGTVVAAAALAAAAALLVRPAAPGEAAAPRPKVPASGRAWWALAALTAAVVLVAVVADVREELPLVIAGVDMNTFHLPNAARWIETGSLWQIDTLAARQPYGYYPNSGELLYVWALLPFDSDVLVRWVIPPLLALWALAAYAVVRELGGPPAAGVLAACALVTMPIAGLGSVSNAMPDVLLYAAMTAGLLFLLRHRRSGYPSDLVLAGLGLGLGFGTKWYGVSAAAIAIVVWMAARIVGRTPWRAVLRDGALTGGVAALAGGVWLVRNLVESGNPVFPVRVSPLGFTIFDAPPDIAREAAGFSIAHYLDDPDVLFGRLPGEILEGTGLLAAVAAVLVVVAIVAARRIGAGGGRILTLGVAAVVLAAAYAITPYSALGAEGEPNLANFNTRYLVPALIAGTVGGAALAGRSRLGPLVGLLLATAALSSLPDAYGPLRGGTLAKIAIALTVLGAVAALVWRAARSRPPVVRQVVAIGAGCALLVGAVAYAHRTEGRLSDQRYAGLDSAVRVAHRLGTDRALNVGLAGQWSLQGISPVWASFGPRLRNHVEYIGYDDGGWLAAYERGEEFTAAVREAGYDMLVIGRGRTPQPHVRHEDWVTGAGYVEVTRSERLIVYASPTFARDITAGRLPRAAR